MNTNERRLPDPLDRLLGPDAPEVSCETCFERLDEYVELERAGAAAEDRIPGLGAHLQGGPACREEHESLHALLNAEDGVGPAA